MARPSCSLISIISHIKNIQQIHQYINTWSPYTHTKNHIRLHGIAKITSNIRSQGRSTTSLTNRCHKNLMAPKFPACDQRIKKDEKNNGKM